MRLEFVRYKNDKHSRPKSASTCCPIGFDQTDDDEDGAGVDDAISRGGSSGGLGSLLPFLCDAEWPADDDCECAVRLC